MSDSILSISNSSSNPNTEQQQFLRFNLVPNNNLMIALREIAAVLKIPLGQIVPIPEMPSWVMGVYNWRGQIVWMVDMGELLGFTPWYQQSLVASNHKAIVIHPRSQNQKNRSSGNLIGLVVSDVDEIEMCDVNLINSPPASAVTEELAPYLRGYWIQEGGDIIITIDGDAIFASMPQ